MTDDQIRAAVQASPQLQRLAAAGNVAAIAAVLAAGAGGVQAGQVITTRGAAARYPGVDGLPGPLAFEAAMLALETYAASNADSGTPLQRLRARAITRVLDVFPTLGLDFGDPALRAMLDTLVPDVLTAGQAAGFKALAPVAPVRLSPRRVRDAIGLVLPPAVASPPQWGPAEGPAAEGDPA